MGSICSRWLVLLTQVRCIGTCARASRLRLRQSATATVHSNFEICRTALPLLLTEGVAKFKAALMAEGIFGLVRPPLLHTAPPLVINEEQLRDGFNRVDRALHVLDTELGF